MSRLLSVIEKIDTGAAWASGVILLGTAFLIAVEVTLRKGFAVSMGGADEISSYTLAVCCSWTMGFALLKKAHVRIDVLYVRLPLQLQHALDIMSLALFGFVMAIITRYAFVVVKTSFIKNSMANTPLATPLWIPQGLWLTGLVMFTATILALLVAVAIALAKGDGRRARELYGTSTLDQEIEEETRTAQPVPGGGRP